jgi:hypothetical protein
MDITVTFAFLARLLTVPSRLLLVLNTHVEDGMPLKDVAHEQYCVLACSVLPAFPT